VSDAAQRQEADKDSSAGSPSRLHRVTPVVARTAEAPLMPLGDQLFQRLLRHRIIFLGQFLLCAGTRGKRYALPHAQVLMHQPSGGIGGTATDIRIQAEQMLYIKRTLAERIAFHTGQTVEQIETDSDRDRWFTADEARDYGFVDEVVRDAAQVLTAGPVS